jgi:hypothetical protein
LAVALALGPDEAEPLAGDLGQGIAPRPLDDSADDRPPVEARLDGLAQLDVALDDRTVGEAEGEASVGHLRPNRQQSWRTLGVRQGAVVVDQVEAAVAADAGPLELDRLDRGESQPLDGSDRQPGDAGNYSTST